MNEILDNLNLIATDIPVVIHCNSGKRSDAVCYALRQQLNRNDIFSLEGGIQAFTAIYLPEQSCAQ
jgi:rhodanese-related sulfurtransferase